jgi:hypothetical protein
MYGRNTLRAEWALINTHMKYFCDILQNKNNLLVDSKWRAARRARRGVVCVVWMRPDSAAAHAEQQAVHSTERDLSRSLPRPYANSLQTAHRQPT